MNETRKRLLFRVAMVLVALWIAGQVVVEALRYFNDREARQEANAWLQQAEEAAKHGMTEEDAARWLQHHGAGRAYRGETAWHNGKEMENHIVMGFRTVRKKGLWTDPLTAQLLFHFDTEWRFTHVELKCQPYEWNWPD